MDGGAHWIRPMRMILGEIEEVTGQTRALLPREQGETFERALFRHSGDVLSCE
jgi:hypothetical protein